MEYKTPHIKEKTKCRKNKTKTPRLNSIKKQFKFTQEFSIISNKKQTKKQTCTNLVKRNNEVVDRLKETKDLID